MQYYKLHWVINVDDYVDGYYYFKDWELAQDFMIADLELYLNGKWGDFARYVTDIKICNTNEDNKIFYDWYDDRAAEAKRIREAQLEFVFDEYMPRVEADSATE